jgi:3',5'-cyclic AMP phosphodiesterase CpdA
MLHLLLRFSDYETATIGAHLEMIAERERVWWGWWKKEHENFPGDILREASQLLPMDIGLVNRKGHRFYIASCDAMEVGPEGERIPSPDPDETPDYYRVSSHPVWFRFTGIKPTSIDDWLERFTGVPEGDPTLFWIDVDEERVIYPQLEIDESVDTSGAGILHVSDLHFGDDHAFARSRTDSGIHNPTMVDVVVDAVGQLGYSVGLVVVSGDLITKAAETSYSSEVQPMLEYLLERLGVGKEHVVIVPGNHDIPLATEEASPTPTREFRHELRFRDFLRSFYGSDLREIESLRRFRTAQGWQVNVVGLNSVRLRDPDTKEYGYIGHRADPWLRRVREMNSDRSTSELAEEQILNVAVLHHHILPGELICRPEKDRPVSLTLDAGKIVAECQDACMHLILHGHQHIPLIGSTSRARRVNGSWDGHADPLFVIGSGSTGAAASRLPDEMRQNTFGFYMPSERRIRVDVHEFNPSVEPRRFIQLEIPI